MLDPRPLDPAAGALALAGSPARRDLRAFETRAARSDRLRPIDRVVAVLAMAALAPLLVLIALAIRASSPGPVLFRQQRIGRHGELFECLKFRTMHRGAEMVLIDLLQDDPALHAEWAAGHKLEADPRVTRVGRVLRLTNLDELPQLLNIARGEMALVGPRPIVPAEAPSYGRALPTVLTVLPGLTGLWQVSGRNRLPYAERVRLDLHYVAHRGPLTDLGILARTLFAFGPRSGAR